MKNRWLSAVQMIKNSRKAADRGQRVQERNEQMYRLRAEAASLVAEMTESETALDMQKLADQLRYSDPTVCDEASALEEELLNLLTAIRYEDRGTEQRKLIRRAESTLAQRNLLVRNSKQS